MNPSLALSSESSLEPRVRRIRRVCEMSVRGDETGVIQARSSLNPVALDDGEVEDLGDAQLSSDSCPLSGSGMELALIVDRFEWLLKVEVRKMRGNCDADR